MRGNIGLFKAKREDNNDWIKGNLLEKNGKFYIVKHFTVPFGFKIKSEKFRKIKPETLCECTGLKDKNGKLIWENDIVKHCAEDRYVIVEFIDGKFSIEKYGYNLSASNNFEIIGNKFSEVECE